jgi:hypothetical protein
MAKKKSKPAKAAAHRAAPTRVHTKFVSAFFAEFVGGPKPKAWKWPLAGQAGPAVLQDFETFLDVLMTAGYLLAAPTSGGTDSLRDRLGDFLLAQHWPLTAPIPKKWQGIQPTVRLVEVSQITDRLLQAINADPLGAGGGPSRWPPH